MSSGRHTGEVAPGMIKDAGCCHVIIGHSERRQFFGETDESVNKKTKGGDRGGVDGDRLRRGAASGEGGRKCRIRS